MTLANSLRIRSVNVRLPLATLLLSGVVLLAAAIAIAWFAGNGFISAIFQQLDSLQQNPPMWATTPMMLGHYVLVWTVSLMLLVLVIMRVSPQPVAWSRIAVVGILSVLTVRYVMWRSVSTLNLDTPLNGVFSLGLFFLEMLLLVNGMIQLVLLLRSRDRKKQADQLADDVVSGNYVPSVDVLIPTYNEPAFILKRTIIGCQAMDYANKTIYLLDDTRRPEIRQLAAELGCEYRTRPTNEHAKAGNLNYAIPKTDGELIVVFDADFVPTRNFLQRTVGFFQDPHIGLLQTPQTFYNPDPIAWNLGMQDDLPPEEEVFYRQIQRIRDGAGGVVCAGTSFVVRRSALEEIGGFVTGALSEDFFTGIELTAKGYRLIYLNEKLSAGLAAESISAHALQRIRWAQGTLQSFFIRSNPLTIKGLNPLQRLAYFEGLLHWFSSIAKVGFLVMPLAYAFLGVIPIQAETAEVMDFFVPFYLVQLATFSWLNYRSRSALLSDVYALVLAFPLALTVVQVMLRPFGRGFKVTPKGTASDRFTFNFSLAIPLLMVFAITALSLWINLGHCLIADAAAEPISHLKGLGLGWLWSTYNMLMLGIALLALLDAPRPSTYEWFSLRRIARLCIHNSATDASLELWGHTAMLSQEGAEIVLTQRDRAALARHTQNLTATLTLVDENLEVEGYVEWVKPDGEVPTLRLRFAPLSIPEERRLVEVLYCRPGQWKNRCAPSELKSLSILFRLLFRPRVLFDRANEIKPVQVTIV